MSDKIPPGYKRTEIGIIPEDWEVKKVGNFSEVCTGGTPSTEIKKFWGGKIRWMSSGEIHKRFIYDTDRKITKVGLLHSSAKLIPSKCVLIALAGQGKTRGAAAINLVELAINQSIAAIYPSKFHISKYLYYNMLNRYEELRRLSSGEGGRGGLNKQLIKNLQIPLPPLSEQRAIARVLTDFDELIESLDKLIEKKKAIKKGAMQELLTGKKRLPGFSGKWVRKKLGEIFTITRGYVLSTKNMKKEKIGRYKYPVYSSQTQNNGIVGFYDKFLYEDSITWTTDGANAGDVKFRKGKFYCTNVCGVLLNGEGYSNRCIAEIFGMVSRKYVSYVGNPKLMNNVVKDIEVFIPPTLEEQRAIAQILSDMDEEIEALEKKKEKYKMLKKGAMELLLTGKVRLKDYKTNGVKK